MKTWEDIRVDLLLGATVMVFFIGTFLVVCKCSHLRLGYSKLP